MGPAGGVDPTIEARRGEAELLERIAGGDSGGALQAVIDRYSSVLFGFGLRRLGDRGMAEEMVQDTFVRLWRSADRFDPDRGSVRTFVFAIARNAAADLARRRASSVLPGSGALAPEHVSADEPYEGLLTGLEVRAAVATLSDKHRETLELHYDEDLTQREVAERLGIPLGTVKTRTFHALRALRTELEGRGIDL